MATCNDLAPLAFTMLAAIGVTVPTVPVFSPPPLAFAPPGATSNVSAPPPVRSGPPAPPFDQRVAQVYDGQNSASQQRKEAALKGQVRISQKRKERDLSVFTSSLSVARFMGIEAEVSASKAGIVDVSTSLKLSAFSELQLTETSVVIIATASDFFNEEFDVPSLRDGVSVPTTPAEALDFYRRHGDSYVSQVAFGAEFYAMWAVHTSSSETARGLAADFSSSVSFARLEAGVDLSTEIRERIVSTSSTLQYKAVVVGHTLAPPSDTQFQDFATKFFEESSPTPDALKITARGYEDIPELATSALADIAVKRKYFVEGKGGDPPARDAIVRLDDVEGAIQNLNAVWDHYGVRSRMTDDAFEEQESDVTTGLEQLKAQLALYITNPINQSFTMPPEVPRALAKGAPTVRMVEASSQCLGRDEGDSFSVVIDGKELKEAFQRISSLSMKTENSRGGNYPKGVRINFETLNAQTGAIGTLSGNRAVTTIDDTALSRVTRISVLHGRIKVTGDRRVVRIQMFNGGSLAFTSGTDPNDLRSGITNNFDVKDDEVITGFSGKSGGVIQCIRIHTAKFLPAYD